ncbi:alpha/beta fold hydrolase [Mucilaginibacter aquaedulcis]|uniref:alpha/beta fold hydrolase n=1 Tax=Mucilaginibacter aquaedulcis TaxID=1187081 RepID=UPI0025B57CDA|nr:alpha/beta hydrolase [Mucilaginibacter aquaedulcis]MDN3546763.1 alpha/beta hydrolase [Mucilaginibacter aquaedulcis]
MQSIHYRTVNVDGLNIFYREAGDKSKPHLLLLNGMPNASSAFEDIINDLKNEFYLVAPDFPGFGHSDAPRPNEFEYTFDHLSGVIEHFIEAIDLLQPIVYGIGYGGVLTFRIAIRRPELFKKYIFQNATAHYEGLGPVFLNAAPYLENRNEETTKLVEPLLTLEGIRLFYLGGVEDQTLINPDDIYHTLYALSRPGQREIQLELLHNYKANIAEYPVWQQFLKDTQPNILLVWGKNDPFFPLAAAEAIKREVPEAKLYAYNTGHLALNEYHAEIAEHIRKFAR